MIIENEEKEQGTGFLVFKPKSKGSNEGKVFLVTNKHILNRDSNKRRNATKIIIYANFKRDMSNDKYYIQEIEFPLDSTKSIRWKEHISEDVDILAFDITGPFSKIKDMLKYQLIPYDFLVDENKIKELNITIAEEIFVIGYPLGLKHKDTAIPLVRSGIIATKIGEQLQDHVKNSTGEKRIRNIQGFLIDGAIIPGSSGSPVILKPSSLRNVNGEFTLHLNNNLLLGIVSESRYFPLKEESSIYPSYAGLGLAFDAKTIKETIDLFDNENQISNT